MINMKYCRFQNTLEALQECYDDLSDANWDLESLIENTYSDEEAEAMRQLVNLCQEISDSCVQEAA